MLGALVLGFVLLGGPAARAANILSLEAKGGFGGPGGMVAINVLFNGGSRSIWSGIQTARLDNGTTFDAYCVDFYHHNYLPVGFEVALNSIANLVNPDPDGQGQTGGNGAAVGYLYDKFAAAVSNDHVEAAGLQAAIWTVEYAGQFQVTDAPSPDGLQGSDQARAAFWSNAFLADYAANFDAGKAGATWFQATTHSDGQGHDNLYQDMVGPLAAPEPSTLLTAGFGVLGCLGWSWRRRHTARALGT